MHFPALASFRDQSILVVTEFWNLMPFDPFDYFCLQFSDRVHTHSHVTVTRYQITYSSQTHDPARLLSPTCLGGLSFAPHSFAFPSLWRSILRQIHILPSLPAAASRTCVCVAFALVLFFPNIPGGRSALSWSLDFRNHGLRRRPGLHKSTLPTPLQRPH